jgi:hypothetical protein
MLLDQPLRFEVTQMLVIAGWLMSSAMVLLSRYDSIVYLIATNLLIGLYKFDFGVRFPKKYLLGFSVIFLSVMALIVNSFDNFRKLISSPTPLANSPKDLVIVFGNSIKLSIATPLRILGLQAPDWGVIELPKLVFFINLIIYLPLLASLIKFDNKPQLKLVFSFFCFYLGVCLAQSYIRRDWTTPFYLIRTNWSSDAFWPRYFLPLFSFFTSAIALSSKNLFEIFESGKFKLGFFTLISLSQVTSLYASGEAFRSNPTWYWQNVPVGIEFGFLIGSVSFLIFAYLILEPKWSDSSRIYWG